jgi:GDSL-like lipase/acylhydrolase family protein
MSGLCGCDLPPSQGYADPDACDFPEDYMMRILPLGNSITQGDSEHMGWRYHLWQSLLDSNALFDMVGSMVDAHDGNPVWPDYQGVPFDRDHEGHWGWHTNQVLDMLPDWLPEYEFNIVLLHLGSNDAFSFEDSSITAQEIRDVIATLRDANPEVVIFLAEIIPVDNSDSNDLVIALNERIVVIAQDLSTAQSPVIIVDQFNGFDADLDTWDGVHPNDSGAYKMADKWFAALQDQYCIEPDGGV